MSIQQLTSCSSDIILQQKYFILLTHDILFDADVGVPHKVSITPTPTLTPDENAGKFSE